MKKQPIRNMFLSIVAGAIACSPAQAACWAGNEASAVRVRELQTMLMVTTLRCRAAGIDIGGEYNGFVRAAVDNIEIANLRIKQHIAAEGGTQADYDRLATTLANSYGAEVTSPGVCAEAADVAHTIAQTPTELPRLAELHVFPRLLPGGTCSASPPVIVMAAAPPPQPAMLPAEVVAAMITLARFRQANSPAPSVLAHSVSDVAPAPLVLAAMQPGR